MSELFDFTVENHIGVITVHRPPVNVWNQEIRVGIAEILESLNERTDVYCVILRAEGKGFCGGIDVKEWGSPNKELIKNIPLTVSRVTSAFYNCRVPVIAACHNFTIGIGFAVCTVCDFIVCEEDAYFQFPEINVGTVGGPFWLKRIFPDQIARYYLLTGEKIPASVMQQYGAVVKVTPKGQALEGAMEIAKVIAKKYPAAAWTIKQIMNRGEKEVQDVIDINDRMRKWGNEEVLAGDPNKAEMSTAFLEHREPVYDLNFLNKKEK